MIAVCYVCGQERGIVEEHQMKEHPRDYAPPWRKVCEECGQWLYDWRKEAMTWPQVRALRTAQGLTVAPASSPAGGST